MFYEDLKREILQLLATKRFQEALKLIEKELDVPYIPPDFERFLQTQRKEAKRHLIENDKRIPVVDINEIKLMLNTKDTNLHLMAIEAFDKVNLRLIDQEINEFLLRHDVPNDLKSLVLIGLHRQDFDQTFHIWHDPTILEANPKQLPVKELIQFSNEVTKKLEAVSFHHNQSLTNLAIKIALLFLLDFFPRHFYFSVADVAAMAIKRAGKMLNEKISWQDIEKSFSFSVKTATTIFSHQLPSLD